MSVDVSLIIPNKCRSIRDKEHARKYFDETIDSLVKYFHGRKGFVTNINIQEEKDEIREIEYSFDIPLLNVSVFMNSGFWDVWPVANYSSYFIPFGKDMFGKPKMWPRRDCFNTLLAFGQKEGWICDEFHSWNSCLSSDANFEDWKCNGSDAEDSAIYEFNVMDFADVDPSNDKWPNYQVKYHDDYRDCHDVLEVIKKKFPAYDILAIDKPLSNHVFAANDEGLYILNIDTGKSFTDYPIDNCKTDFNGAGFQIFRGEESAFFNLEGQQLTEFRIGEFSWGWDSRDCHLLGQIITDKATGKKFQTDGTPFSEK